MTRALLLGTALTLSLLPSNLPAGALPLLRAEWQATATDLGWVVGAYQLGYAVAVLVVLPLTDRLPPRGIMLASAALTALASLLFPALAGDVWSAAALRILAGAGIAGIYMPGVRLIAASVSQQRRGAMVGLYVAAFYLAGSLSLLLTGILLEPWGWRGAAVALGVLAFAAIPFAFLGAPREHTALDGRARLDPAVLREPHVLRTILAYSGHGLELYVARGWLPAFLAAILVAQGSNATAASAEGSSLAALLLGTGVVGVFVGGAISDRLGRRSSAAGVALASGLVSLLLPLAMVAPWPLIVTLGALLGLLISADSAIYSVLVTEQAPPARLGSAQAFQQFGGFATGTIGPVLAGAALDAGLGWLGAFGVGAIATLGAAAVIAPLGRGERIARSTA